MKLSYPYGIIVFLVHQLLMGIPVSLIPCIILIPQAGQMHIKE